ncbi:MAG TPA: hypothetical protein ACFYD3_09395 [Candidatus Hypogeohydataceae bacterium YC41]
MSTVSKAAIGGKALPGIVLFLAFVVGCTSAEKRSKDAITSTSSITKDLPRKTGLEELPVLQLEEEVKRPEPPRFYGLSTGKASIRDVLLSFSKESKMNIIVDPDVSGYVKDVDLKDVTLAQAMDALLTPMGLEYKVEDGFVRVSRPKPISRIFHFNYIITHRSGERALSTSSGVGTGAGGIGGNVGVGGVGGVSGAAGFGGVSGVTGVGGVTGFGGTTGLGTGGVGTAGVGFAAGFNSVSGRDIQDVFEEIELALKAMGLQTTGTVEPTGIYGRRRGVERETTTQTTVIGGVPITTEKESPVPGLPPGATGVFSINRQAGIILVTAYPDVIAKVAELLEAVEGTIQRQVLIHAKIVEVTLRDEFRYGINYDLLFGLFKKGQTAAAGQGLDEASRRLLPKVTRDIKQVEGFFQFTVKTGDMETILEALSFQGDVNVISSPKISTLNNQTAIIKVGTQKTFFTVSTVVIPATPSPITQESVGTNTITIGVTLDVTPQVSPDGFITMNIHPSVTDQTGTTKSRLGDEAPILDVRETDTVIRVKDGETIAIGGLMQDKKTLEQNMTPLLSKIPAIGFLFKQVDKRKQKTDLVIFLTPTILLGDRIEDLSTDELQRLKLYREVK